MLEPIKDGDIFVFGSNLAGRHGAGAALHAMQKYGAILFQGVGLQGKSYGIPTKDQQIRTMTLESIGRYVDEFIQFAKEHPELSFYVTPIGCGLAGYTRKQIRPMFDDMPSNCRFAETWDDERPKTANYDTKYVSVEEDEQDGECIETVEEWLANVNSGGFIDYDGHGHPMKDGLADRSIYLYPSGGIDAIPLDATHVVWFNK